MGIQVCGLCFKANGSKFDGLPVTACAFHRVEVVATGPGDPGDLEIESRVSVCDVHFTEIVRWLEAMKFPDLER